MKPASQARSRCIAIIGALLLISLVAGCSALRLGYSQGSTLAYWWLDSYLDFDSAQSQRARDALTQWFAWHRKNELPQLADILARAEADVLADASSAQACRWFDELQLRFDAAVEQALPGAAEVAVTLRPDQLDALRKRQARANAEFRDEYMQPQPEARAKADLERTLERSEMLYGRLDAAQRERIVQIIATSPFDPERWLADRQRRQRDLVQTLQQIQAGKLAQPEALVALRGYWQRSRRSPDEVYGRYVQELNSYNCAAAARLHNVTTAAQREVARKKLRGWEADLRSLAAS